MPKHRKASHNLGHYRLFSASLGHLVPCCVQEIIPGDTFVHSTTALVRVAALAAPLMHPVQVRIHHWFVPYRLLWTGWEDFITGKNDALTVPQVAVPTENYTDLLDHMGIPDVDDQTVNVLNLRAYQMIWNEFYRDQDLDTPAVVSLANGPDTTTSLALQRVRWEKDYFTTAREYPQMGDTSVTIPFAAGSLAPVKGVGLTSTTAAGIVQGTPVRETDGSTPTYAHSIPSSVSNRFTIETDVDSDTAKPLIYADLSQAEGAGIDVNDYRRSVARQIFLERRNRFGSRYVDFLRFMGVNPSDARLQRPEYLGGGRSVISFSEVLATAETTAAGVKVGSMAGHGIVALRTPRYRRFFEEHGVVLSLFSVRPKVMYAQQLHRMWERQTKDDFFQLENQMEGPQPVLTRELYAAAADPTTIFGWQGRHDDYRRTQSYVSGLFRPGETAADWHLAREFDAEPALNSAFLECVPKDDVFQSANDPQLYCMTSHDIRARRLVSARARY